MTYKQTILQLIDLLSLANKADSDNHEEWQVTQDAGGMFEGLAKALVVIAGNDFFDYWCKTGELDFTLASRNKVSQADKKSAPAAAKTYTLGIRKTPCGAVAWAKSPSGDLREKRFRNGYAAAEISARRHLDYVVNTIKECLATGDMKQSCLIVDTDKCTETILSATDDCR